jgi:hypothetical protein
MVSRRRNREKKACTRASSLNPVVVGACCPGDQVIPVINRLRKTAKWDLVALTQDFHPKDHCSFSVNNPGVRFLFLLCFLCDARPCFVPYPLPRCPCSVATVHYFQAPVRRRSDDVARALRAGHGRHELLERAGPRAHGQDRAEGHEPRRRFVLRSAPAILFCDGICLLRAARAAALRLLLLRLLLMLLPRRGARPVTREKANARAAAAG